MTDLIRLAVRHHAPLVLVSAGSRRCSQVYLFEGKIFLTIRY